MARVYAETKFDLRLSILSALPSSLLYDVRAALYDSSRCMILPLSLPTIETANRWLENAAFSRLSTFPAAAKRQSRTKRTAFVVCELIGVQREILDGLRSAGYVQCCKVSHWE